MATDLEARLGLLESLGVGALSKDGISATAWFSGDVGNVVKVEASAGDCRIEIVLVAYEVA